MHERLRDWLLQRWAMVICDHPRWVLSVAIVLLLACVGITLQSLEFQADRNELISKELAWNQWFIDWREQFTGQNDLFVIVDVGVDKQAGDIQQYRQKLAAAQTVVGELAASMEKCDSVQKVVWGFPGSEFSPRALRLDHWQEFEQLVQQMQEAKLLLVCPTPGEFLKAVMAQMNTQARATSTTDHPIDDQEISAMIEQFGRVIEGFSSVIADTSGVGPGLNDYVLGDNNPLTTWRYLESPNGRLLFIRVTPKRIEGVINAPAIAIGQVREVMAEIHLKHVDAQFGLTGIEVVEADETAIATRDSVRASILAVVLIAILLICAFHSFRTPLLLIISLLIGVGWSFGFLTVTIGHLQVISVVFTVILLGLGIAFGIHIASCFEMLRHQYTPDLSGFARTLRESFRSVGPGIVTGAITTSVAFCMTLMTDFVGVAEMGFIAGVGVLLCLISMLTVFPALLRIFRSGGQHVVPLSDRKFHFFNERWVSPFVHHPKVTLGIAFVLTTMSVIAAMQMSYDFDLLKLQPANVDSVIWQERIVRDGEQSIWAATSLAGSLDQARALNDAYMKLPNVASVVGAGWLFPDDDAKKIARLKQAEQLLRPSLDLALADASAAPAIAGRDGQVISQLVMMRIALAAAQLQQLPQSVHLTLGRITLVIDQMIINLQAMTPTMRNAALARLHTSYHQWRSETAQRIAIAIDGKPLVPDDLSPKLLEPYMARLDNGSYIYALEIHPRLPADSNMTGPLDPQFLQGFMQDLESIDPQVTGVIAQVYRSGDLIKRSYIMAGWLALLAVFVLVLLDFRSLGDAILCLMPVAVGFAVTFGIMWLVGMKINPANIIVLPLMFGIGVDAGVHVLHRYRNDPASRPLGLTHGTGKGITVTSFTSMIGFGVMMLGQHRGIRSLGFVMFVGIGMTMLACLTLMPAWLEVMRGKKKVR